MGSATEFAIAIMILFASMICFFVAFHPGGINFNGNPIQNPDDALKWLMGEFETTTGG